MLTGIIIMKFRYIFLVALVLSAILSFVFSMPIYRFYLRTYHITFRGETRESSVKHALKLFNEKKYSELKGYLTSLIILFPDNADLKLMQGLVFIREGHTEQGAGLLLDSLNSTSPNRKLLYKAVRILFKAQAYADIASELGRFDIEDDSELLYYRGVSVLKTGKPKNAFQILSKAERAGKRNAAIYYYLGLCAEQIGEKKEALGFLIRARHKNPLDQEIKKALARMYQLNGLLGKSERILRSRF